MSDAAPAGLRRNHALWLAPLLAIPACLSYWLFFARWALFRDVPWLNLLLLGLVLGVAVLALRRAWPRGGWRRVAGVAGVAWTLALTALLVVYCFVLSYDLPDAALAADSGEPLPAIALAAQDGTTIDLGETGGGPLVLVFYRGFW